MSAPSRSKPYSPISISERFAALRRAIFNESSNMRMIGCAFLLLLAATGIARAKPDHYLTDVLKDPAHARAVAQLFRSAGKMPPWTAQILKRSGDYADSPATYATLGSIRYELNSVCKAHDCFGNQIEILFAPGGKQAWGALIGDSGPIVYLGNPDAAKRAVLKDAIVARDPLMR